MESLGKKCGYTTLEDWYNVKASHFRTNKGIPLLLLIIYDSVILINIRGRNSKMFWQLTLQGSGFFISYTCMVGVEV